MLKDEEENEKEQEQQKEGNVEEGAGTFKKASTSVVKEDSLHFQGVGVAGCHYDEDNSKDESNYCNNDFPSSIVPEEAECYDFYFDLVNKIRTPSAMRVITPRTMAMMGADLGQQWVMTSQRRPREKAARTVHQKAALKPE